MRALWLIMAIFASSLYGARALADSMFSDDFVAKAAYLVEIDCSSVFPCRLTIDHSAFTFSEVTLSASGVKGIMGVWSSYQAGSAGYPRFIMLREGNAWRKIEESFNIEVMRSTTNGFYDLDNGKGFRLVWSGHEYVLSGTRFFDPPLSQGLDLVYPARVEEFYQLNYGRLTSDRCKNGCVFQLGGSKRKSTPVHLSPNSTASLIVESFAPGDCAENGCASSLIAPVQGKMATLMNCLCLIRVADTITDDHFDLIVAGERWAWTNGRYERSRGPATTTPVAETTETAKINKRQDVDSRPSLERGMVVAFTVLTHVVLFAAALLQLWLISRLVLQLDERSNPLRRPQEMLMRGIAGVVGLLLYLGSRAIGLSVPELSFKAMSMSFPFAIAIGGILVPSAVGVLVSWFVVRHISGRTAAKDAVAMRVLTMVMALVFFIYCDSWLYTFSEGGKALQFVPNLVFVLAALLYAVFKYQPYDARSK